MTAGISCAHLHALFRNSYSCVCRAVAWHRSHLQRHVVRRTLHVPRCTLHAAWCSSCLAPLAPGVVRDQAVCTRRAARVVRGGDPLRVGALELQAKPDIRFSFALLCPQGRTLRRPNARSAMQCDATRCDLHARQADQTALPLPRLLRLPLAVVQTPNMRHGRLPACAALRAHYPPSRAEPSRAGPNRARPGYWRRAKPGYSRRAVRLTGRHSFGFGFPPLSAVQPLPH